ncbi:MAG: RagB/SusD family nutrient uptake outer membrane protein [Tannerella sp.]|jgi:hypothetical protein|nr:RagB/SusD family nutrient uptake outer membrane protein [Tannerella sp.]
MKLKYIISTAILLAGIFSCDVTDLTPLDSLTDESYWNKPEDLKLYATRLYTDFVKPSVKLDERSDNCLTTNYNDYLFNEKNIPTNSDDGKEDDQEDKEIWSWKKIRACNFFMTRYKQVPGDDSEINPYVAEVRFFRALDYFKKIKKYGDVPYYDKDLQTNDTELLYKARDSRDFVLGKIIEDLEFAIEWLPEPSKAEEGRLHKYVAMTQLARVCLHEGTFRKYHNVSSGTFSSEELLKKAATMAEAIMSSGLYDIVKGDNAGCGQMPFDNYPLYYSNQFIQESLVGNRECILPRIYIVDLFMHQTGRQAGEAGIGYSKDFIESFLCKDGKPIAVSSLYQGDETLEQEIMNRDPRLYQIIDNKNKPYLVMNGTRQVNPYSNVSPSGAVTGYQMVKFKSPLQAQAEARKTTYDWFLYRYAEVLLIFAEAKAELGECTQDVLDRTINLLRDRVEMSHLTVSPEVDANAVNYGYTISPLLYEIRRERRIELADEGFRWDDIVRWKAGKLLENPKTFLGMRVTPEVAALYPTGTFYGENGVQTVNYNGKDLIRPYAGKGLDDTGRKWTANDKRYLEPIPLEELTLNSNLTQNPGWE